MTKTILVIIHDFRGGGAEKVSISLANEFSRLGHRVHIAALNDEGPMKAILNPEIQVGILRSRRVLFSIHLILNAIRKVKPDLLISHMTHINVATSISARLIGYHNRHVAVEHNMMEKNFKLLNSTTVKLAYKLSKWVYKWPNKIVAVSNGVKNSVISFCNIPESKMAVIYNPVVEDSHLLRERSRDSSLHHFFSNNSKPVFLGVGSLTEQKNFANLIRAFYLVKKELESNLLILGEGPLRSELKAEIASLKLNDSVELLGFKKNVPDYMLAADVFVLSSDWEGLPTVLIEAMSYNMRVVSTACPSGPDEILLNGKYGDLAELNNPRDLANKMISAVLNQQIATRVRARDFLSRKAAQKYLELLGN